jgi:anti-sigma B factor antagonist
MADLTIIERMVGKGVVILECSGKVTIDEGAVQMRRAVRNLIARGQEKILLNLGRVEYIDSSGIGELVSSFTAVRKEGGNLKILTLTQAMQDLLTVTKILPVFEYFDSEEKAVASFA